MVVVGGAAVVVVGTPCTHAPAACEQVPAGAYSGRSHTHPAPTHGRTIWFQLAPSVLPQRQSPPHAVGGPAVVTVWHGLLPCGE
ncbi:hypothetical protein C1280_27040 [Gemmata obscuriglobus]|uniref:Uncharacterized protein n=1 Tax=Gemmata obscuriglobus TaxID=114 RepID=A0A2Z3H9U0_9BACT|nr:hypothetical protein C1280_27040 [Gemmata obscuriglobus]